MMARLGFAVLLSALAALALAGTPARAQTGDAERGKAVYEKRCIYCHGEEGDADVAVAERLNPPPRDFSEGQYKIKTTGFDDPVPNDSDLFRMIRDGMPGTAMPGWSDMLSDRQMWDLVAYIKIFAGLDEEKPSDQLDYGTQVASSEDSIAKGMELFGDRCTECHGDSGTGVAIKKLKNDAGARTWPRNLTKPWTFRASADPKDIFTRITVGIPGTQMPSFADPKSKKKLSIEQRWHVANYVVTVAKTDKTVRPENTVVGADKIDGELPAAADDPRWQASPPTTFFLVPQIIAKDRFFTPSNDTITVRALYNDKHIALLLEWDDRTESIPGDAKAESIADPPIGEDAVAVQLPVTIPTGMEKPYFGMGDAAHPVNLWQWKSGTSSQAQSVGLTNATGFKNIEERDARAVGLRAKGSYGKGSWKVVMTRPRATEESDQDIQFVDGRFIPIAFAAWDGSNAEKGSRHTMTTWYWLLLKPATGSKPIIVALILIALIGAGEWWWVRSAAAKTAAGGG